MIHTRDHISRISFYYAPSIKTRRFWDGGRGEGERTEGGRLFQGLWGNSVLDQYLSTFNLFAPSNHDNLVATLIDLQFLTNALTPISFKRLWSKSGVWISWVALKSLLRFDPPFFSSQTPHPATTTVKTRNWRRNPDIDISPLDIGYTFTIPIPFIPFRLSCMNRLRGWKWREKPIIQSEWLAVRTDRAWKKDLWNSNWREEEKKSIMGTERKLENSQALFSLTGLQRNKSARIIFQRSSIVKWTFSRLINRIDWHEKSAVPDVVSLSPNNGQFVVLPLLPPPKPPTRRITEP